MWPKQILQRQMSYYSERSIRIAHWNILLSIADNHTKVVLESW